MPTPVTPTGVRALDRSLGKASPGFPLGAITEIHGLPQCGSTALCIAAATAALDEGEKVVYFDYGGDVLERLKVEDGLTVYVNHAANHPTAFIPGIVDAVRAGTRLVVIDSIDRNLQDRRAVNVHRIQLAIAGSSTAVLFVRRYPIHPDPSPWDELAFSSQLRIRLSCHRDEYEENVHKVRAELVKVKTGKPRAAEFYLRDGLVDGVVRTPRAKTRDSDAPSRFDREDII